MNVESGVTCPPKTGPVIMRVLWEKRRRRTGDCFGGLDVSEARRLRRLEDETARAQGSG